METLPGFSCPDQFARRIRPIASALFAISHSLEAGVITCSTALSTDADFCPPTACDVLVTDGLLRFWVGNGPQIAKDLRAIPDEMLDKAREFPTGKMTVQQRIERVLIGHLQGRQGSIEATVA